MWGGVGCMTACMACDKGEMPVWGARHLGAVCMDMLCIPLLKCDAAGRQVPSQSLTHAWFLSSGWL